MNIESIIGMIIGSQAIFTFLQFLISRHDGKNKQLKSIKHELDTIQHHLAELDAKNDTQDARTSRTRILQFDDEIVEGRKHSREYFLQILDDCEVYDQWTKKNPNVKNGYAKQAVKHIKKTYEELLDKGEWKNE